jgi:uncharacterized protein with HEPN domain
MRRPEDRTLLLDMLEHARRAVAAGAGRSPREVESDAVLAAALERFVEIVGEAASKISQDVRETLPEIPWREIVGMRNRLIHGYGSVDRNILLDVVQHDLPPLIARLERALIEH